MKINYFLCSGIEKKNFTMNFLKLYSYSFHDNWERPALTDYTTGETITYGQLAAKIASMHLFFAECDVKPGDKIALEGLNSISWVVVYMSTVTYGAVIVPLSGKYEKREAMEILRHSDSVMLFVSEKYMDYYDFDTLPSLRAVVAIDGSKVIASRPGIGIDIDGVLEYLQERFDRAYPSGFCPSDVHYHDIGASAVVSIDYTSGTTGAPKGAMITADNLGGNVIFGIEARIHRPRSRCLSYLPLSHAYGCAFDMLVPLATGSHITLFDHPLTISALLSALKKVRPYTVLFVPVVFERLFMSTMKNYVRGGVYHRLFAKTGLKRLYRRMARRHLEKALGGEFREIVIGGAPLNSKIEDFLSSIGFRFTVGYGMIECAPLISYSSFDRYVPHTCGRVLDIMRAKVVGDDHGGEGEICVKGMNLMRGYYKNPEATAAAIDADGWFHTGDIGTVDADGVIRLSGRASTSIDGADGQPIYPEKIELRLNGMPFVVESLIVEREGKLTALIYPDREAATAAGHDSKSLVQIMKNNIIDLNRILPLRERVSDFEMMEKEFVKTTKFTIKRFLYR